MSMSTRFHAVRVSVSAAALLASAGFSLSQTQTTLNFVAAQRPETYAVAIAEFETRNPDVKVAYQQIPFAQLNAQIEARIGEQDAGIDVYGADTPRIPAFVSREYLLNLEEYRDRIEEIADATAIEQVSVDGTIYAFPHWSSSQLLYYNKDLLDQASIAAPSTSIAERMTWSEMLESAKAAKDAGAPWGFGFEQVDRYYQLQALFESAGAGSGLSGEGNLTPDVASEKWVETADWYRGLYESGIAPRGVTPEQMPDLFQNGDVAFYVGQPNNFVRFNNADGLNYGVAPMPYFEGGKPATPTGSWAIGINPYAANMEEAKRFAEFLTLDAEGAFLTVSTNPLIPVHREAYERYINEIVKGVDGATDIMTYELANTAVGRPRSVGYVVFEEVMNRTFSDIRNGADAASSLEQAQRQLTSSLGRIR